MMRQSIFARAALAAFVIPALAASPIRALAAPERVVYSFSGGPDGYVGLISGLISVNDTLYGTTIDGGTYNYGTIYSVTPDGHQTILHSFRGGDDGRYPYAGLLNVNGVLYGTTGQGGGPYNRGSVFRLLPDGKVQIVYSFSASAVDGSSPEAPLIDVDGTLYGTTENGGAYSLGTVFAIAPDGSETVLHSFTGYDSDGAFPITPVVDVSGTLYGTTGEGGVANRGCAYAISPTGTETVLHVFGAKGDGSEPFEGLTYVNGQLYGVTGRGGAFYNGTVFQMTLTGAESVLYSFPRGTGGAESPLLSAGGKMFGTTVGKNIPGDYGTVYSITPAGRLRVIYSFAGEPDGALPQGSLAQIGGSLYGTTDRGGVNNIGAVYTVSP